MASEIKTASMGIGIEIPNKIHTRNEEYKYSVGDIVKFRLGSGRTEKGNIRYIEGSGDEVLLYINSFNKWAYKVPGADVLSRIS